MSSGCQQNRLRSSVALAIQVLVTRNSSFLGASLVLKMRHRHSSQYDLLHVAHFLHHSEAHMVADYVMR